MAWDFANGINQSMDEGANFALKKKQLAFERVKQMYEMHTQAYQHAWTDVINNDKMPNSMKTQYYNNVVVPYNKNYLGVDTPPVAKWTNDLNDAADKMAGLYDDYKAGKIKLPELQSAMVHIKAEVASNPDAAKAFQPTDEVLNAAMGKVQKEVTVGGKKMLVSQDENGQLHPVSVNGQEASGPTSESITSEQNRQKNATELSQEWMEAAKIVEAAKDPGLLAKIPFLHNKSEQEIQDAVNSAHAQMYMIGGRLGIKSQDVTNVIMGKKSSADVMNQVGKNFALPGATNPAPAMNLPGLTVQPKQLSQAPAPTPEATTAEAPQTTPEQLAQANTAPSDNAMSDNPEEPTDKEEANV